MEEVLSCFKCAQLFLEGEKQVTISFVLHFVVGIKLLLEHKKVTIESLENPTKKDVYMKNIIENILKDYSKRWGDFERGIFNGTDVVHGDHNRQVGIHPMIILATRLDPRKKSLRIKVLKNEEKEAIWNTLEKEMMKISQTMDYIDEPLRKRVNKQTRPQPAKKSKSVHQQEQKEKMQADLDLMEFLLTNKEEVEVEEVSNNYESLIKEKCTLEISLNKQQPEID